VGFTLPSGAFTTTHTCLPHYPHIWPYHTATHTATLPTPRRHRTRTPFPLRGPQTTLATPVEPPQPCGHGHMAATSSHCPRVPHFNADVPTTRPPARVWDMPAPTCLADPAGVALHGLPLSQTSARWLGRSAFRDTPHLHYYLPHELPPGLPHHRHTCYAWRPGDASRLSPWFPFPLPGWTGLDYNASPPCNIAQQHQHPPSCLPGATHLTPACHTPVAATTAPATTCPPTFTHLIPTAHCACVTVRAPRRACAATNIPLPLVHTVGRRRRLTTGAPPRICF